MKIDYDYIEVFYGREKGKSDSIIVRRGDLIYFSNDLTLLLQYCFPNEKVVLAKVREYVKEPFEPKTYADGSTLISSNPMKEYHSNGMIKEAVQRITLEKMKKGLDQLTRR